MEPVVSQPPVAPVILPSIPPKKFKFNNVVWVLLLLVILLSVTIAFFVYQNLQLRQQLAVQPTPVSSVISSPTPDPATDWKTYTNEKVGFEIKYPRGWTIGSPNTSSRIVSFDTKMIANEIDSQPTREFVIATISATFAQDCNDYSAWLNKYQAGTLLETETINSREFCVSKGGAMYESMEYATKTKDGYLRFFMEPFSGSEAEKTIFDQILSTFRFTE